MSPGFLSDVLMNTAAGTILDREMERRKKKEEIYKQFAVKQREYEAKAYIENIKSTKAKEAKVEVAKEKTQQAKDKYDFEREQKRLDRQSRERIAGMRKSSSGSSFNTLEDKLDYDEYKRNISDLNEYQKRLLNAEEEESLETSNKILYENELSTIEEEKNKLKTDINWENDPELSDINKTSRFTIGEFFKHGSFETKAKVRLKRNTATASGMKIDEVEPEYIDSEGNIVDEKNINFFGDSKKRINSIVDKYNKQIIQSKENEDKIKSLDEKKKIIDSNLVKVKSNLKKSKKIKNKILDILKTESDIKNENFRTLINKKRKEIIDIYPIDSSQEEDNNK